MQPDETTVGFVEHAVRDPNEGSALSAEGLEGLRADGKALGLFGLLVAGALREAPEVDPEVRDELTDALSADLRDALGGGEASESLADLCARYRAAKRERGPELLARLVARVAYELYDLRAHGFLQEDALIACQLLAAGRAAASARDAALRTTRLGRTATRIVLGHLDSQLDLVHRLGNQEQPLVWPEIDRRLDEFAPRVFAQRWPSIASRLLQDDKRFRFVCVLWARLRGVDVGRTPLVDLAQRIDPRRPMLFIQALEEARPARAALVAACAAAPVAALVEDACAGWVGES
ncbi:MAG: hypothetical protein AB7N76_23465 [Planctomycetota bacterium]